MSELTSLWAGIGLLADWQVILMMILGLLFGIVTGAIPGFSTPLAISVMLPVTFGMDSLQAIVFLTCIYAGGNFGSSISAILINIPGSPQAIVTGLDGYPMTQQGRGSEALGVAVAASAIGNLLGAIFLILILPLLVKFALSFGPPELFLVGVIGLTIIASLHKSFLKAAIAGLFGVLIGTIGMTDTGAMRGTWGFYELLDGVPLIPALIGLIGFSELFMMLQRTYVAGDSAADSGTEKSKNLKQLLRGFVTTLRHPITLLRASTIGVLIGGLPGAGATVASVVSYNEGRRYSKNSANFGKGEPEGVINSEAANNASEGGALALLLSLGIPGGLATAVLIGGFMLQGLVPGPRLFMDNPALMYGVMTSQVFASFMLLFFGLVVSFYAAKIIRVPTMVLIPLIALFSIVGTYAVKLLMFDVYIMLVFAVVGVVLRKFDYPLIAVILGLILGPILDDQLMRTYQGSGGLSISIFLERPMSLLLLAILALSLLPLVVRLAKEHKKRAGQTKVEQH
ncbi:tripartite tricarboxylate transporter permease [Orrella daihaiensis]|uniref:Tripartite tricarboxylate transporter permease n=1 Tax=Orrella daihaiensis TaxID=2782176 RepID=A0ABY4AI71_9BURK|nr:tripartite tricarboxylate transporter permease [Orrella daihaiensis]UOD49986.1 tripartite tricarboxylate transporter permease [Orrella daihaiensis]